MLFLPITTFQLNFCTRKVTVSMSVTSFGRINHSLMPVTFLNSSKDKKCVNPSKLVLQVMAQMKIGKVKTDLLWMLSFTTIMELLKNMPKMFCLRVTSSKNCFPKFGIRASIFALEEAGFNFVFVLTKFALCLTLYLMLVCSLATEQLHQL